MTSRRITYRDLRNTPAKVFERLAKGEPLELLSDGTTKAVLIPVEDDDPATALDAWRRGRALLALARIQSDSRRMGTSELGLPDITREIKSVRKNRRSREAERQ